MSQTGFDEKTQEALGILFENFWVLRSENPSAYQLIRERETGLKRYVSDKFGFDLVFISILLNLKKSLSIQKHGWESRILPHLRTMQFSAVG